MENQNIINPSTLCLDYNNAAKELSRRVVGNRIISDNAALVCPGLFAQPRTTVSGQLVLESHRGYKVSSTICVTY